MLDRGEDLRTTPTVAGRAFSSFILVIILIAATALCAYGVDAHHHFGSLIGIQGGMWSWRIAAIISAGALLTAWASASKRDDTAGGLWYLTHLAFIVTLTIAMA